MRKELLDIIKRSYPKGTRVVLVHMDDVQAPKPGTKGTVIGVDDLGSLLVNWDNGSSLNVIYGEDRVEILRTCPKCGKEYQGYPPFDSVRLAPRCRFGGTAYWPLGPYRSDRKHHYPRAVCEGLRSGSHVPLVPQRLERLRYSDDERW